MSEPRSDGTIKGFAKFSCSPIVQSQTKINSVVLVKEGLNTRLVVSDVNLVAV
jgi:hypothetical protein